MSAIPTEQEPAIKLRVDSAFKAEIEDAAREMHVSVSAFTRLALADYVKARKAAAAVEKRNAGETEEAA